MYIVNLKILKLSLNKTQGKSFILFFNLCKKIKLRQLHIMK